MELIFSEGYETSINHIRSDCNIFAFIFHLFFYQFFLYDLNKTCMFSCVFVTRNLFLQLDYCRKFLLLSMSPLLPFNRPHTDHFILIIDKHAPNFISLVMNFFNPHQEVRRSQEGNTNVTITFDLSQS